MGAARPLLHTSTFNMTIATRPVAPSGALQNVSYEIRGQLARRAHELERQGYDIISLNIGNPGQYGLRAPETMRLAMIENLRYADAYSHHKGIFPAREAVAMQQQERGVMDASVEDVFMGNGVSELIDLTLRAMLGPGDEVLVPSPDYPLWTAAVTLNGGKAVHYPCLARDGFQPDVAEMAALVSPRTRAIVVINPNNPTGAVYSRSTLQGIVDLADAHGLVVMADEIYDRIVYDDAQFVPMASLVRNTLCATFSGLSKVYRACGYRVGWAAFSGARESAQAYLDALELLCALRLCSNVPGQWAVQTALGGRQSIDELTGPNGRLYRARQCVGDFVSRSRFVDLQLPAGSIYAFLRVRDDVLPDFDDHEFAVELLEEKHVLVAPGSSFNFTRRDHFRITLLPSERILLDALTRIEQLLARRVGD